MTITRHRVILQQPYDLDVTVDSWIYPDIQPTPEIKKPGMFARCIPIKDDLIPIRVIQHRKGSQSELVLEWPIEWQSHRSELVRKITWLLGLDIDTQSVLKTIRNDPIIAHLAEPLTGLRPYSLPSMYEALIKAILQQQISYRAASQITRELVLNYGTKCNLGNFEIFGFPTAEQFAALSEEKLRQSKVGYKSPYLQTISQQVVAQHLNLNTMAQMDSQAILAKLDALHGVGPWTAELTVLTGLRRLDIFPCDDLGVRNIISALYHDEQPLKRKQVEQIAKRWGFQASLVLYYLMCAQVLGFV